MTVPCVRVEREDGENTRTELASRDLLDFTREITHEDGYLYIPVTDKKAVPEKYHVVDFDPPKRDTQTMPADLVDFHPSYERLGRVAIIDEDDPDRARELADAIVESDIPVKTVLNRASKIQGQERIREWDVLVGEETEVLHREYGYEFELDLARVYFSPRLATERHRVIEQVEPGERVLDMFAGVGPFAIPMAGQGAEVVAVDVNEVAIDYLERNARRNKVEDSITAMADDVREVAGEYTDWADRIVMNLPHSADEFLETAVAIAGDECVLHYYDIQHEDDPFGPGEEAIRNAAGEDYDVSVQTRRKVRSYAPREYNVVLDALLQKQ